MKVSTRVATDAVNDLTPGDFLRVIRRTVRPSADAEGFWDIEFEFERARQVDENPGPSSLERVRWLVERYP